MLNHYDFSETSSRNVYVDGEQVRVVTFRGTDQRTIPHERLNIDGSFVMPIMDYFMAGANQELNKVIHQKVVERLSPNANEDDESEE